MMSPNSPFTDPARSAGLEEVRPVSGPDPNMTPDWLRIATIVGPRSSDDPLTARVSRAAAENLFPGEARRVAIAHQVHGGRVRRVTGEEEEIPGGLGVIVGGRCDGLWTSDGGICLTIRTADCAPVAIWDERNQRMALVHSGWRGTLENILGEALHQLKEAGSDPETLRIWVGPAIGMVHFEVGEEVCEAFSLRWPDWKECWRDRRLDIGRILTLQAAEAGVPGERIHHSGVCTFGAPEGLPSHRREGNSRVHSLYTLALLRE